jgi:hypothetical protein
MKAKTWIRDSHGLFDYENTTQVKTVSLNISSHCIIIRDQKKHDIKSFENLENLNASSEEELKEIAKVSYNGKVFVNIDKYYLSTDLLNNMPINNQTLQDLQEKIWYVIKTNNPMNNTNVNTYQSNFEYVLKKNDIIKLGRIKFLIRDMNIVDGNYETSVETFKLYQEFE